MIEFTAPALTAPDSCIVGAIVDDVINVGAIVADVINVGAIKEGPESFGIPSGVIRLEPGDSLPDLPGNYLLNHTLSRSGAVAKSLAVARLLQLRREGATIVLISHDEALLENCADEIWWIRDANLIARGDPPTVLAEYRRYAAEALRAAGSNYVARIAPTLRYGDGRAVLKALELLDSNSAPATVFRSGEEMAIRITVQFISPIPEPVIGVMIRSRVGLNVYGTNTELEQLKFGPVEAGAVARITCRFACTLCPGEYTVTAASHDPDGLWHDWMEDAVGFTVSDSRYTAGVANLKARVEIENYGQSASI